ncbi:recombination-associated protein RdgC [Aliiglaciecola sp. CAU 1673]|uniref:recombination-associated protein RdgC n=1 Tax=Aliiglaciecola sp. CAU 1673 TaxID=3032595 RepID=UPI0023DCA9B6|nr:recombination-associated protein RdgC [Aliiglaciecola sp. CAU 1673]MDF2180057.1 recombination-associated protein RdgC [Aliiglaciecola sp. CAU 1673]
MWFKNLKIYHITQPLELTAEELQDKLSEASFRPCGSQDLATMGWSAPLGQGESLVHSADGKFLLCLKKQERILPSVVVNGEVEARAQKIELETGAPVGKKAKADIKQEVIHHLLPKAFTRDSYTFAFMAPRENLVVVDSSNDSKAETLLATLRKAIGSLPVVPIARRSVSADLTQWLQSPEKCPQGFELLEEAELKSPNEDGATIRCKNQPLDADEVQLHLQNGKLVQKLAIEWDETLSALLQEDLAVKRVKFSDVLREQNQDIPKDQQLARLDADFCLMAAETVRLIKALDEALALTQE